MASITDTSMFITQIDNFYFRILNKNIENDITRLIVNIYSSTNYDELIKLDSEIDFNQVNKFSVYLSNSDLGCFRLCLKLRNYIKGDDYIQTTFIHIKLQEFIYKYLDKLVESDTIFCLCRTQYLSNDDWDKIIDHIEDKSRQIEKEPFKTYSKFKCGDIIDDVKIKLDDFSILLEKLYNYSDNEFIFNYIVNNINIYNIQFYKLKLKLKLKNDFYQDNIVLYYCNVYITQFLGKKLNNPTFYNLPIFLTIDDQITKFGTFNNYILAGNYICKIFDYTEQCMTTLSSLFMVPEEKNNKCFNNYYLIGDRYDNIFPLNYINRELKLLTNEERQIKIRVEENLKREKEMEKEMKIKVDENLKREKEMEIKVDENLKKVREMNREMKMEAIEKQQLKKLDIDTPDLLLLKQLAELYLLDKPHNLQIIDKYSNMSPYLFLLDEIFVNIENQDEIFIEIKKYIEKYLNTEEQSDIENYLENYLKNYLDDKYSKEILKYGKELLKNEKFVPFMILLNVNNIIQEHLDSILFNQKQKNDLKTIQTEIQLIIKEYLNNKKNINRNMTGGFKIDIEAVERLLNKQHEICSNILTELKQHRQKKSHWSWYIFPTNKPGKSDPLETYITKDTAQILLKSPPPEWRLCLEQIVTLAIEKNYRLEKVLFDIDIGRVKKFIKFWKEIPNKPIWLSNVCDILHVLIKKN